MFRYRINCQNGEARSNVVSYGCRRERISKRAERRVAGRVVEPRPRASRLDPYTCSYAKPLTAANPPPRFVQSGTFGRAGAGAGFIAFSAARAAPARPRGCRAASAAGSRVGGRAAGGGRAGGHGPVLTRTSPIRNLD